MQYEVEIQGRMRRVVVHRVGDGVEAVVDGRSHRIDGVRINSHVLSLIVGVVNAPSPLSGGVILEIAVASGARGQLKVHVGSVLVPVTLNGGHRRKSGGGATTDGPQRLVAPMPGKIVRVLVAAGDAVGTRQPLVVVEAMKMENELRALRDGTVANVRVKEGDSVDAGAPLMEIR